MKRRGFLKSLPVKSVGGMELLWRCTQTTPEKHNFVLIMVDNLGYGGVGCYGPKKIKTPHIDAMAAKGLLFKQAYAGCTVCAPSRSVLMTGYHMGHTSVRANSDGVPLLDKDVTPAEVLKKAGYATGGFGKWGLVRLGVDPSAMQQIAYDDYAKIMQITGNAQKSRDCSDEHGFPRRTTFNRVKNIPFRFNNVFELKREFDYETSQIFKSCNASRSGYHSRHACPQLLKKITPRKAEYHIYYG